MARTKKRITKKRKSRRYRKRKQKGGNEKSKAYVINLDKRTDRWNQIQDKFKGSSIELERVSAVENSDKYLACSLSHLKVVQMAKDNNMPTVLIFEDDNKPEENYDKRWQIVKKWLDNNKDKWEIFNGGGAWHPYENESHEKKFDIQLKYQMEENINLFNCAIVLRANFIYINSSAYDKVLKWSRDLPDKDITYCLDTYIGNRKYFNTLCIYPFLATQENGVSDLMKIDKNTTNEDTHRNKFMNGVLERQAKKSNKKILLNLTGGLGNRLFQIFAGLGFAERWNIELYILKESSKWNHLPEDNSFMEIKEILPTLQYINTKEKDINYNVIGDNENYNDKYNSSNNDILLDGYFQDVSLFPKKEIKLNLLKPDNSILNGLNTSNIYFIHFRFGDYNYTSTFKVNLLNYYKYCINKILQYNSNAIFIVVSDNINEVKEYINKNLEKELKQIIYDNNKSRLNSLYYMSQCKGGICANSTFSWFGAYCIKDKNKELIFMPTPWRSDSGFTKIKLYPEWATIVDVNIHIGGNIVINYNDYIYNKTIVFTLTSKGYIDYTYNLYKSLIQSKIPWKLMIVCTDEDSHNFFNNKNIKSISYKPNTVINKTNNNLGKWGNSKFMSYNRIKLELIEKMRNEAPNDVQYLLYTDGDVVFFKDFLPYLLDLFSKDSTTSMYFQSDDGGCGDESTIACTGFFIIDRKKITQSPFAIDNENEWLETKEDQKWVNNHLKKYNIQYKFLNRKIFPNGGCMHDGYDEWKNNNPYILHYNFLVGHDKKNKMIKNNHWFI